MRGSAELLWLAGWMWGESGGRASRSAHGRAFCCWVGCAGEGRVGCSRTGWAAGKFCSYPEVAAADFRHSGGVY